MSSKGKRTFGMNANTPITDLTFTDVVVVIIVAWVIVALTQRFIENLAYNTFGLNKESTWHSFIVLLSTTVVFFSFVFLSSAIVRDIVEGEISQGVTFPTIPPPFIPPTTNVPMSIIVNSREEPTQIPTLRSLDVLEPLDGFEPLIKEGADKKHKKYKKWRK